MSTYGEMYRRLAEEKRREAEAYEHKAREADRRELEHREAERIIAETDPKVIRKAQALYRSDPIMHQQSDDGYATWIGPLAWDQLYPVTQLEYINRTCSDY